MKNLIHKKCAEMNVSQSWVAKRVGLSRQALNKIANNNTDPHISTAIRLANVLKCSVEDLFIL